MSTDPKFDKLARDLTAGEILRVRIANGICPRDGQNAYLVQGGRSAGLVTTQKTAMHLGTIEGCQFWGWGYPFAFLRPNPDMPAIAGREMSAVEACKLLGVQTATFAVRCRKSNEKAWPDLGGVHQQCSVAEPYTHVCAYRIDPRGRWHVTLFGRPSVLVQPREKYEVSPREREMVRGLLDGSKTGRQLNGSEHLPHKQQGCRFKPGPPHPGNQHGLESAPSERRRASAVPRAGRLDLRRRDAVRGAGSAKASHRPAWTAAVRGSPRQVQQGDDVDACHDLLRNPEGIRHSMSDPIPLRAEDDGKVYAYLCGHCRMLHMGGQCMDKVDGPVPACVDLARDCADRCCRCKRCPTIIGRTWGVDVCEACRPAEEMREAELQVQIEADRDERDAAFEAAIAKAKDQDAAILLLGTMGDISENEYCAGWMNGLEYELWDQAFGSGRSFGPMFGDEPRDVTQENDELRRLSAKAGGWWRFDDEFGRLFIPTDEWAVMFANRPKPEMVSDAELDEETRRLFEQADKWNKEDKEG